MCPPVFEVGVKEGVVTSGVPIPYRRLSESWQRDRQVLISWRDNHLSYHHRRFQLLRFPSPWLQDAPFSSTDSMLRKKEKKKKKKKRRYNLEDTDSRGWSQDE
jgi:hypothetical protein